MFIAMNCFQVTPGREQEFEQRWKQRESFLATVPGFRHFALLRGTAPGEYISHSTWVDEAAFTAWTRSEAFTAGHRQGTTAGLLAGPPQVRLYQAVIEESARAETGSRG